MADDREVTILGQGASLEGNIVSAGSLRIDGQIKGQINADGDVALSPQSQVDAPRQVVVRSADEWARVWRTHAPDRQPPAVDFSREMAVGVFLGSRPTAGYAVEILGVREAQDGVVVQYRRTTPPRDMITAQVITTPYHIVAIPKRDGPVRFEEVKG